MIHAQNPALPVTIVVGFHEKKTHYSRPLSRAFMQWETPTPTVGMSLADFPEETTRGGQILQLSHAQHGSLLDITSIVSVSMLQIT